MKAFFINLDRDAARCAHMVSQLELIGVPFERVAGTLGCNLTPEQLVQSYDDRWARLFRSRSLTPAEIGCALSHIEVYRRILAQQLEFALILEDDTVLPADTKEVLAGLSQVIDGARPEIYLLSPAEGEPPHPPKPITVAGYRVLAYQDGFYASAYVVTKAATEVLLRELYPVRDVADCWVRLSKYGVLDMFVLKPALVLQDQGRFGSSTTADIVASQSHAENARYRYLLRRVISVLFSGAYTVWRRFNKRGGR